VIYVVEFIKKEKTMKINMLLLLSGIAIVAAPGMLYSSASSDKVVEEGYRKAVDELFAHENPDHTVFSTIRPIIKIRPENEKRRYRGEIRSIFGVPQEEFSPAVVSAKQEGRILPVAGLYDLFEQFTKTGRIAKPGKEFKVDSPTILTKEEMEILAPIFALPDSDAVRAFAYNRHRYNANQTSPELVAVQQNIINTLKGVIASLAGKQQYKMMRHLDDLLGRETRRLQEYMPKTAPESQAQGKTAQEAFAERYMRKDMSKAVKDFSDGVSVNLIGLRLQKAQIDSILANGGTFITLALAPDERVFKKIVLVLLNGGSIGALQDGAASLIASNSSLKRFYLFMTKQEREALEPLFQVKEDKIMQEIAGRESLTPSEQSTVAARRQMVKAAINASLENRTMTVNPLLLDDALIETLEDIAFAEHLTPFLKKFSKDDYFGKIFLNSKKQIVYYDVLKPHINQLFQDIMEELDEIKTKDGDYYAKYLTSFLKKFSKDDYLGNIFLTSLSKKSIGDHDRAKAQINERFQDIMRELEEFKTKAKQFK
jgi:hypothetical protein